MNKAERTWSFEGVPAPVAACIVEMLVENRLLTEKIAELRATRAVGVEDIGDGTPAEVVLLMLDVKRENHRLRRELADLVEGTPVPSANGSAGPRGPHLGGGEDQKREGEEGSDVAQPGHIADGGRP